MTTVLAADDVDVTGVRSSIGWFRGINASVGVGTSLLDGLFRFDVARVVRGAKRWKVHLYWTGCSNADR
ncbi:MAG: hypothetical protein IIB36_01480 [Gemmatimonadetes bacterium]|nr:hypothetical protein [Gemmatimonadota bacterium]